jgi:hypothetical protein
MIDAMGFARSTRASRLWAWGLGGAEGDRTPDLLIANEALSQLSYGPAPDLGNRKIGA